MATIHLDVVSAEESIFSGEAKIEKKGRLFRRPF